MLKTFHCENSKVVKRRTKATRRKKRVEYEIRKMALGIKINEIVTIDSSSKNQYRVHNTISNGAIRFFSFVFRINSFTPSFLSRYKK